VSVLALGLLEPVFWLCASGVVYTYLGYPVLIALLARVQPAPPVRKSPHTPAVSVVIAVHNEEDTIERKLGNSLALDYPQDRLEVVVASDGSDDRTNVIVASYPSNRVRLVEVARGGKAHALNAGVAGARGDVLVMTDAREEVESRAVRELVASLADPAVGAVSGELHIRGFEEAEGGEGVGLYWRYEKAIRRAESLFDSTVGVTGALYAVRRELYVPLDPRTVLDDVAVPMRVVMAGYRVVFESAARVFDRVADTPRREYGRKTRTLAGNYQLLALLPELLDPRQNRLFFQLVSHKVARLAVPWWLLLLYGTSGLLAAEGRLLYVIAFAGQSVFYLLAVLGWLRSRYGRGPRVLDFFYSFTFLNLAAAVGLVGFLRGAATAGWKGSTS
jgi:cellulose synthase/poly-beta-1,6-N-acetylglucosamine synthase-like glycosyltransferase